MSATDLAKDAIRVISTAGLSKDVIDLLKEKITLLDEKVNSLTAENNTLKAENYDLKKRLDTVEQKDKSRISKPEGFDDATESIIDILFENFYGISMESIAQHLNIELGFVEYHFDLLFKADFAIQYATGPDPGSDTFGLTDKGRAYKVNRNR